MTATPQRDLPRSNAYMVFTTILADVRVLSDFHPTQGARGRPKGDTRPLLRAMVVNLVTAWENYVEALATENTTEMLRRVDGEHQKLPGWLVHEVAIRNKDEPWNLAGDGWLRVVTELVEAQVSKLNTPSAENVDQLFARTLSISKMLSGCYWQKSSAPRVRRELDSLVLDVRGEIVHKGTTPTSLSLQGVRDWINFIEMLVDKFDRSMMTRFDAAYPI